MLLQDRMLYAAWLYENVELVYSLFLQFVLK